MRDPVRRVDRDRIVLVDPLIVGKPLWDINEIPCLGEVRCVTGLAECLNCENRATTPVFEPKVAGTIGDNIEVEHVRARSADARHWGAEELSSGQAQGDGNTGNADSLVINYPTEKTNRPIPDHAPIPDVCAATTGHDDHERCEQPDSYALTWQAHGHGIPF
jgi:hypothetical protein